MKKRLIAGLLAVCMLIPMAGCAVRNGETKYLSYDDAKTELTSLLKKVDVDTVSNPVMYIYEDEISEADMLADIETFPITVRGNAVGDVMFYGPGAGSLPTASAVVGGYNRHCRSS